ncbi:MAG: TonB-dependent receptor [Acidobacteria bacterium]|nr:MAG: TonB-dependent receptor [Acidobacteriota bacterium]
MIAALIVALLSLNPAHGQTPRGTSTLQGIVVDAVTQAPLAGARIWLVDLGLTTFSGKDGRFAFANLPAGSFTITVSEIGYIFVKRKIDLPDKSTLGIVIPLAEGQGTYTEDVTVVAEAERTPETGVASQMVIGSGGLQSLRSVATDDPMRAMQALPGVTSGDDFRAEFTVRGASFRQMGTVIDGVATPLLVHTVKGRSDTGSVAMINTDVLDSASLAAGAQPARDGNWLGGTLKFTVREGSRDRTQLRIAASDTGASFVIEGPLGRKRKGSWLYSARKSYADWLIRKLDPTFGSTLGFVDTQTKFSYDLTPRQQVQFLAIGGDANYYQANTSAANGLRTADTRSIVGSLVWRYTRPTLLLSQRVSSAYSDFENHGLFGQNQGDGHTRSLIWRTDALWSARPNLVLEAGAHRETTHDQRVLREYSGSTQANLRIRSTDSFGGTRTLTSAWAQSTVKFTRGAVVAGIRGITDSPGRSPAGTPWVLGEWKASPRLQIRAGAARSLQYPDLFQSFGLTARPLVPERAESYDLGADLTLAKGLMLRASGYRRNEHDILRPYNAEPRLVNGKLAATAVSFTWNNSLEGTSRGWDVMLQRKATTGLVGWLSYGWSRTRYNDLTTGESFDGDFDQRHTVNVFIEERLSYRTAVSVKVRTGSSPPLPGYFRGTIDEMFVGDVRNQVRLPTYLRVDLRANRTFTFDRRRLTLFLEIINATGRRNLGVADGSVRSNLQAVNYTEKLIPWLPSIGFLIEF